MSDLEEWTTRPATEFIGNAEVALRLGEASLIPSVLPPSAVAPVRAPLQTVNDEEDDESDESDSSTDVDGEVTREELDAFVKGVKSCAVAATPLEAIPMEETTTDDSVLQDLSTMVIAENEAMERIGTVLSIVQLRQVVIQGQDGLPPLDAGSALCVSGKQPLGWVS